MIETRYRPEEVILNPKDTEIQIEAYLDNTEDVFNRTGYGTWLFSFYPYTPHDYQIIETAVASALEKVEQRKPEWSRKIPTDKCTKARGTFACNTFLEPKTNVPYEAIQMQQNPHVSLTLHLRDDPDGDVYLQCSYCDFMDPTNGIDEPVKESNVPEDYEF